MIKALLLPFLLIGIVASCNANEYSEGDHFTVLKGNKTKTKEVREYFSFYCPHCFSLEPFMHDLATTLPKGVKLIKNPVDRMPGQQIEIEQALIKAMSVAKMLKIENKIVAAIFNTIHVERKNFATLDDIKQLFLNENVSSPEFDKYYNSFAVNTQFSMMQNKTAALRAQKITTVPALVVNGIYKANTSKIKSAVDYKALINYLLSK